LPNGSSHDTSNVAEVIRILVDELLHFLPAELAPARPLPLLRGLDGSLVRIRAAIFALLFRFAPLAQRNFQASGPQKYSATRTIRPSACRLLRIGRQVAAQLLV